MRFFDGCWTFPVDYWIFLVLQTTCFLTLFLPCNRQGQPQGIYSHQTALALFDLSDAMPQKIHLTVPRSFRRNASVPPVLVLHYGVVISAETEMRQGYHVTRPLKTIIDLLQGSGTPINHIRQALTQGLARGLITRSELACHTCRKELHSILKG
jgi:hypothetical protein